MKKLAQGDALSLPKGWEWKKLGKVCEIKPPKSEARKKLAPDDEVTFLPMEDLGICQKLIHPRKERKLSEVEGSYTYFAENDVLLAKITPCFENGKLGIAKNLKNGIGFGSSEYIVFRSSDQIYNEYLFYYLSQESFRIEGAKRMAGAVGHKRVAKEFIEEFVIPVPPISEQKRIVAILNEALAAISKVKENAQKNLVNAKELFESYLQGVFANPEEDWEEKRLGEVCESITKGSSPKWQGIKYVKVPGVLFITSENIGQNKMIYNNVKYVEEVFNKRDKKSILKEGDVLTNIVGASIGRTAIFDRNEVANINQAVCLLRCNEKLLFNKYLAFLLNSPYLVNHLHDNEINNARANLSLTFFRELSIPIPKISTQKSIVQEIDFFSTETIRLAEIFQQKIASLDELKKSILKKAFEGAL